MLKGDLEGKVAIVTGAGSASGIGAASVEALCRAGARVVMADVAEEELTQTAKMLANKGFDVAGCPADISSEDSVKALIAFALKKYGQLDILDNNAATHASDDSIVTEMPVELWDRIFSVNVRGTMLMCKHAVPAMIAGGGGSIINISSGTSFGGADGATAYATSKGAINTLTKYVAVQYGPKGVRCNALILGLIQTGTLTKYHSADVLEAARAAFPIRRLGEPQDIAEMVAFLASDRARNLTGSLFEVDGGFLAQLNSPL